jgi:hypothetical protein
MKSSSPPLRRLIGSDEELVTAITAFDLAVMKSSPLMQRLPQW